MVAKFLKYLHTYRGREIKRNEKRTQLTVSIKSELIEML
jgi:hypothetical protein